MLARLRLYIDQGQRIESEYKNVKSHLNLNLL
jgi:hypothetical protein